MPRPKINLNFFSAKGTTFSDFLLRRLRKATDFIRGMGILPMKYKLIFSEKIFPRVGVSLHGRDARATRRLWASPTLGLLFCLVGIFLSSGCQAPNASGKARFPGEPDRQGFTPRRGQSTSQAREHWRQIITSEWLKTATSYPVPNGTIRFHGKKQGHLNGKFFTGTVSGEVLVTLSNGKTRFVSLSERVFCTANGTVRTGDSGYTYAISTVSEDNDAAKNSGLVSILTTTEAATWNPDATVYAMRPSSKTIAATKTLADETNLFPDFSGTPTAPTATPDKDATKGAPDTAPPPASASAAKNETKKNEAN